MSNRITISHKVSNPMEDTLSIKAFLCPSKHLNLSLIKHTHTHSITLWLLVYNLKNQNDGSKARESNYENNPNRIKYGNETLLATHLP